MIPEFMKQPIPTPEKKDQNVPYDIETQKKLLKQEHGIMVDLKDITFENGTWYVKGIDLDSWLGNTDKKDDHPWSKNRK